MTLRFCDRRTKTDNVISALNQPIIQRTVSRSYAYGSESSSSLLREARGCFAFHSGRQFGYVPRRGGPQQHGSGQGCAGDLQSESNYDRGCTQHHVKGGKLNDSKSCAPNSSPCAPRFHCMECLPCRHPAKTCREICGAHT